MTSLQLFQKGYRVFVALVAILVVSVLVFWIVGLFNSKLIVISELMLYYLKTLFLAFSLVVVPLVFNYFKKRITKIDKELPSINKVESFLNAYMVKIYILFSFGFVSLTMYALFNDNNFLLLYGLFLAVLVLSYPSKAKIASELETEVDELFLNN